MSTVDPPASIKNRIDLGQLVITWHDGVQVGLPFHPLRAECACARCVDEMTGRRIVGLDDVDPTVAVAELKLVGNYALKITWSDGHDTGLFTWVVLRRLCDERRVGGGD